MVLRGELHRHVVRSRVPLRRHAEELAPGVRGRARGTCASRSGSRLPDRPPRCAAVIRFMNASSVDVGDALVVDDDVEALGPVGTLVDRHLRRSCRFHPGSTTVQSTGSDLRHRVHHDLALERIVVAAAAADDERVDARPCGSRCAAAGRCWCPLRRGPAPRPDAKTATDAIRAPRRLATAHSRRPVAVRIVYMSTPTSLGDRSARPRRAGAASRTPRACRRRRRSTYCVPSSS